MYQFPMIELANDDDKVPIDISQRSRASKPIKHILSHQHIFATFHHFDGFPRKINDDWMIIDRKNIQDFPLPRVIDRYLEETSNS
jgi:hypothetical protein